MPIVTEEKLKGQLSVAHNLNHLPFLSQHRSCWSAARDHCANVADLWWQLSIKLNIIFFDILFNMNQEGWLQARCEGDRATR